MTCWGQWNMCFFNRCHFRSPLFFILPEMAHTQASWHVIGPGEELKAQGALGLLQELRGISSSGPSCSPLPTHYLGHIQPVHDFSPCPWAGPLWGLRWCPHTVRRVGGRTKESTHRASWPFLDPSCLCHLSLPTPGIRRPCYYFY